MDFQGTVVYRANNIRMYMRIAHTKGLLLLLCGCLLLPPLQPLVHQGHHLLVSDTFLLQPFGHHKAFHCLHFFLPFLNHSLFLLLRSPLKPLTRLPLPPPVAEEHQDGEEWEVHKKAGTQEEVESGISRLAVEQEGKSRGWQGNEWSK